MSGVVASDITAEPYILSVADKEHQVHNDCTYVTKYNYTEYNVSLVANRYPYCIVTKSNQNPICHCLYQHGACTR